MFIYHAMKRFTEHKTVKDLQKQGYPCNNENMLEQCVQSVCKQDLKKSFEKTMICREISIPTKRISLLIRGDLRMYTKHWRKPVLDTIWWNHWAGIIHLQVMATEWPASLKGKFLWLKNPNWQNYRVCASILWKYLLNHNSQGPIYRNKSKTDKTIAQYQSCLS